MWCKNMKISEFKKITIGNYFYFEKFFKNGYSICIEPCLNGFDVGLYQNKILIGEKICTNCTNSNKENALEKALNIAKIKSLII